MSIEIKIEKVIIRGEQFIKIKSLSALKKQELPKEYTDKNKSIYLASDERCLKNSTFYLWKNELYAEETFLAYLKKIKTAGTLLQKINKELAEKNKDWHNEETFII